MPARVMCVFECRYDSYKFHCACDECKVEASGKCNASGDLSTKRAFFAWDCTPPAALAPMRGRALEHGSKVAWLGRH